MTVKQLLNLNELLCDAIVQRQDNYDTYKENDNVYPDSYSDILKFQMEDANKKYDDFLKMEVTIKWDYRILWETTRKI